MDEWRDHASVIVAGFPAVDRRVTEKVWVVLDMDKKEAFDRLLRAYLGEQASILRRGMRVVRSVVIARVIFSMQGMPVSELLFV